LINLTVAVINKERKFPPVLMGGWFRFVRGACLPRAFTVGLLFAPVTVGRVRCADVYDSDEEEEENRRKYGALLLACGAASWYTATYFDKLPLHNSVLTGEEYTRELLNSRNDMKMRDSLGMSPGCFRALADKLDLKSTRYLGKDEALAICLYSLRHAADCRVSGDRFQRAYGTVTSKVRAGVKSILRLHPQYMPQRHNPILPPHIRADSRFFPFFDGAVGAIDGCHIHAHLAKEEHTTSRNRKGEITQNVLGVCDFEGYNTYVLAGSEGAAYDGWVYKQAVAEHGLKLPTGCFLLADAGYTLSLSLLVPYRGVRYHLKEWARGNKRPQNARELFNLRHAQLRNVIERQFGQLKRRFKVLRTPLEYDFDMQIDIVYACCILHNFMKQHDGEDLEDSDSEDEFDEGEESEEDIGEDLHPQETAQERREAEERRDNIANAMWLQYQAYLRQRGERR
jgi:hypothetical protein